MKPQKISRSFRENKERMRAKVFFVAIYLFLVRNDPDEPVESETFGRFGWFIVVVVFDVVVAHKACVWVL